MPIGDLLASITGEPSPTTTSFPPPKRKADDDLRRPLEKVQKTGTPAANSSRPITQSSKSPVVESSASKSKVVQSSRPIIQNSATSTFKNGQPTPPPTNDPPKPPKKGSFAEIMARGKAAQNTLGQIGKIQHKKIEKLPSKREREAMQAQKGKSSQRGLNPKGKFSGGSAAQARDGKNGMKSSGKVGPEKTNIETERKAKKAATATTGYAGTARPRPDGSKAPPRSSAGSSRDRGRFQDRGSSRRYDYYASEEEDEEMEEEEDYYSDESDMEAAAFEVDEEEEAAARIARKEDAEALAEENRLKREKLEKKRKLEALAKKAPGQRY